MMTYVACYFAALFVFVVLDMAWLAAMAPRLYRPTLDNILIAEVNLPPAIMFYLFYPVGLVVFALIPALKSESITIAAAYGALFGFLAYATYDLTNYSTLRNWTIQLTIIDLLWGTMLSATAATVSYLAVKRLVGAG
jgi:uncharacterized membrane protein